ncbi:MAG: DUF2255 family protein [Deltaproteobacteria bacterium]|nr:DUF2255 family protein [Deltaproteobacteria bacterium]
MQVATVDPDGDLRLTRIWLALLDGTGTIRTNETRWLRNLKRDPNLRLRISGVDHPLHVEFIEDDAEIRRVDAAFREKYGWRDRMVGKHDYFMRLVAPSYEKPRDW